LGTYRSCWYGPGEGKRESDRRSERAISTKADLNPARSKEIATFCADLGIEVFGRVPYDNVVTEAMVHGLPATECTDDPMAEAIEQAWAQTRIRLSSGGEVFGAGM
jgi:MinD superfamily P-loop ATPase